MQVTVRRSTASKKGGFTLVELLVTTAITSIILLTASTVLMTFFLSNTRTNIRRQLKSEGNRALSRIEFVARGARSCVNNPDESNTSDITITRLDGSTVRFRREQVTNAAGQNIWNIRMTTVTDAGTTNEDLLSAFVEASGTSFLLDCVTEPNSEKQYAHVRFTLQNFPTNTVTESFSTLAVLRNSQ